MPVFQEFTFCIVTKKEALIWGLPSCIGAGTWKFSYTVSCDEGFKMTNTMSCCDLPYTLSRLWTSWFLLSAHPQTLCPSRRPFCLPRTKRLLLWEVSARLLTDLETTGSCWRLRAVCPNKNFTSTRSARFYCLTLFEPQLTA